MSAGQVETAAALSLPAALVDELLSHARRESPNEACGLLSGERATGAALAYHPARNEHASPYRFSVDARDLVRITYAIEASGQVLLAIFHSHPRSAAEPSATDVREAHYAEAVHLVAGSGGELKAWRITDGRAIEVPLDVEVPLELV